MKIDSELCLKRQLCLQESSTIRHQTSFKRQFESFNSRLTDLIDNRNSLKTEITELTAQAFEPQVDNFLESFKVNKQIDGIIQNMIEVKYQNKMWNSHYLKGGKF